MILCAQVMIPAYPEEDVDAASNSGILDEEDDLRSNMEEGKLRNPFLYFLISLFQLVVQGTSSYCSFATSILRPFHQWCS